MSRELRIRTLRLVNWHNFTNETLPVDGSLFLIGDNGAGKTTLLDAVHCALTGNLDVELNAAARVRGRRDEGRSLTGIALRHDLERGFRRPDGAVAYAALELRADAGAPLSIGLGVFAASPESRPETWGFIAARPVTEVPLVVADGAGERPADRAELAEALGAGAVTDIGRYRTRLGERLFGSRDALEQVAAFLAAGKAYRELVGKTEDFSELFAGLLPAPDAHAFHEIRRALVAIDQTRTDLSALEEELALLRALVAWTDQIEQRREALARYAYVARRHERDEARTDEKRLARREREAGEALDEAVAETRRLANRRDTLQREQGVLRASDAAGLLERRRHAGLDRDHEEVQVRRLEASLTDDEKAAEALAVELEAGGERLAALARAAGRTLEVLRHGHGALLEPAALGALGRLTDRLQALADDPDAGFDHAGATAERRRVRAAFDAVARAQEQRAEAVAREAEGLEGEVARLEGEQAALRARGEVEPPLPALGPALADLGARGVPAVPLYRLLEPAEGTDLDTLGLVERALGRRRLATMVVPSEHHEAARACLLADHPGVPLALAEAADVPATGRGLAARLALPLGRDAARAFVDRHLGPVAFAEESAPGARLTPEGHLRAGRAEVAVGRGPARWVGAEARARAFADALAAVEAGIRRRRGEAEARRREQGDAAATVRRLREAAEEVDGLEPSALVELVAARAAHRARHTDARARAAGHARELSAARGRLAGLEQAISQLDEAIRSQDLEGVAERMEAIGAELAVLARAVDRAAEQRGALKETRDRLARELAQASKATGTVEKAFQDAREALLGLVPQEARGRLDDYVFRLKKGQQIKPENLPELGEGARREITAYQTRIAHAEGVRHPRLWQKYAFRYDADTNVLTESTGRSLAAVVSELQAQVDELTRVLRGRNEELLERILLEDLVSTLRGEVFGLEDTIRQVNALMGDLVFGRTRYRIEPALRPEHRRLHRLLERSSALTPVAREDLKAYFAARLDDLSSDEGLPEALDYRRWFDFGLRMSTVDEAGVELSRERLRKGSGGEQAVPSYLLLFCLTTLLYDRADARLRVLLLDEAFYGIDGGRRETLLRFCGRAKIDLVVATPDLDGVTEALPASTTLLVERTPEGDVFLHDHHFRLKAADLFEAALPDPAGLVLGVDAAREAAG